MEGVVAPSAPTDRDSLTGGEIGKSDPVSRGPELPARKVGDVPDLPTRIASDTRPDAPTLQDSITGPTAPVSTGSTSGVDSLTSMANDLKANVVKHMKIYMPLEQTDYSGVILDYTRDSFDENDHEFPLVIEHYLSRINMDGSLSETDRKIKAIYDDLVSMKNPDNSEYKTLFERREVVLHGKSIAISSVKQDNSFSKANFSKKSDLRGLFKKHDLNPDNVQHLFMDSQNQYKFDQMLNTPIRDVIYKGSVMHKTMKKNIEDVRQKVMTSEFSSFDQFVAEMDLIASKYG